MAASRRGRLRRQGATRAGGAAARPTYEQKIAAILHLEDRRVLADASIGAAAAHRSARAARRRAKGRVRRRAALGIGRRRPGRRRRPAGGAARARIRSPTCARWPPLRSGLIGDGAAAPALLHGARRRRSARAGPRGRGARPHRPHGRRRRDRRHGGGARAAPARSPGSPRRRDLSAGARRGGRAARRVRARAARRRRAAARGGARRRRRARSSDWWPLAYAVQRRRRPGRRAGAAARGSRAAASTTRAFAARGLGALKDADSRVGARGPGQGRASGARRARAGRCARWARSPIAARRPCSSALLAEGADAGDLRLEAVAALGAVRDPATAERARRLPRARVGAAARGRAGGARAADPEMFMTVLSGLDADPHWTVRAALATTLGGIRARAGVARASMQLVRDPDPKVRAAALSSPWRRLKTPTAGERLLARTGAIRIPRCGWRPRRGLGALEAAGAAGGAARARYEASAATPPTSRGRPCSRPSRRSSRRRRRRCSSAALADPDWAVRVRAAALLTRHRPRGDGGARASGAGAGGTRGSTPRGAGRAGLSRRRPTCRRSRGEIRIELAVLDAPRTVANFVALVRPRLLQRPRLAPRRAGLRRAERRSARRRRGRSGLHHPRRAQRAAVPARHRGHGARLEGHRRQPVLHHALAAAAPRRPLHRVRHVVAGMDVVDRLEPWDTIHVGARVGRRALDRRARSRAAPALSVPARHRTRKRGHTVPPGYCSREERDLPLLGGLLGGLLRSLLCLLSHVLSPLSRLGCLREELVAGLLLRLAAPR